MPMVSVIMPAYNAENTIADSITSVQSQIFTDFELIIVNDCSLDKTRAIAESLALTDSRISILDMDVNSGAGSSRSYGIKESKGRYIAFLDADDLWRPEKLEKQITMMRNEDLPFVCSSYSVIDEDGRHLYVNSPPSKITYNDLLNENMIGCLTVIFDTQFFGRIGMPPLRKRQDYALWLSLLKKVECCVTHPEVLASYRITSGSLSSNKFGLLIYNYRMFRSCEDFGRLASIYYVLRNIISKIMK